ncbi:MAG: putative porin [bacterium]
MKVEAPAPSPSPSPAEGAKATDPSTSQLDLVKLHVIVIKDNPSLTPQASDGEKAGQQLADEIVAKLRNGGDFQVFAMMYSQDPSKKYGGNLGWVERKAIKKKLADIAFSMKPGEISYVIPMDHRFFILKTEGARQVAETAEASAKPSLAPQQNGLTTGVTTGRDSFGVGSRPERSSTNSTLPPLPVDAPPSLEESADKMATAAPADTPTESVTINLINRLVRRGILTKGDAADLVRQANEDAKHAAQQAQTTQQAATLAASAQQMASDAAAPPTSDEQVSVSYVPEIVKAEMRDEIKRDVIAAAQSEGWNKPNTPEWLNKFRPFMDFRYRYQGNTYPSSDSVTNTMETLDTLNFNAINTGSPLNMMQIPGNFSQSGVYGDYPGLYPASIFPIAGQPGQFYPQQSPGQNPPTYNTTQQRQQMRVRFRFGADMNLGEDFTSGFRLGTGQNGSPVSENQTLGLPGTTSQGGNFSGYAIWLDRAFLKYEIGQDPDKMAAVTFGRFDNPFFTPTTIMWANDIGFDGIALQGRYKVFKGFTPFVNAGIFPVFNTDLNFASTQQPKLASQDKYLYAAQAGIDWKITKDLNFKGSLGYYFFQNVQGQVSAPGVTPNAQAQMSTDASRPSFAQRGNTYMEIRNIQKVSAYPATNPIPNSQQLPGAYIPTPVTNNTTANYYNNPDYQNYVDSGGVYGVQPPQNPSTGYTNSGTGIVPLPQYQNQYQYFGLVTPFNIISANARLEYRHWEPFVASISGEWDQNLAFNRQNVLTAGPTPGPDNNYNETLIAGPVNNISQGGGFNGGNNAWILQMKVGSGALQKRWDWDFGVSYRYVESDAVIDGFCDSDFGGGGTNLKGWGIGGNLALSKSVFIGLRWLNATGIAGPTYKSDIIQLDINARF